MRLTLAELEDWRGREALDADAEPVGEVVGTLVSEQSGAPRWLALRTGAHGDELTPVPVEGAEPTGAAIRIPYAAGTIRAAPHQPAAGSLSPEQDRELCAFYGLDPEPSPAPQPAGPARGVDDRVVAGLRDAHALEREAISRLQALIGALEDIELQHDAERHLTETRGHAAALEGRLEQLQAARSPLQDAFATAVGKGAGLAGELGTGGDPGELLRDALEFERRECAFYGELLKIARDADDDATAAIAQRIRDDEEAMAETIAASLRRMGKAVP